MSDLHVGSRINIRTCHDNFDHLYAYFSYCIRNPDHPQAGLAIIPASNQQSPLSPASIKSLHLIPFHGTPDRDRDSDRDRTT